MNITASFLLSAYILNFIFIVYILFFERNDSARRFSWLLAIAFIPIIGISLYVLFSGNFFTRPKRMLKANEKANEFFRKTLAKQQKNLDILIKNGDNQTLDDYGPLIHMNLLYGKSPVFSGNSIHIFKSGEEKYKCLFKELSLAKDTIHLSYFTINNDETGRELVSILTQKANEGISVKLLYDYVGSLRTSSRLFKPLLKAGGQVSRFFPVSILVPFTVNYRNHRKLVIIDGHAGYFGGMNIGDEYANRNHARPYYWRDTHVRVTGHAVALLQKQFLVDWYTSHYGAPLNLEEIQIIRYFPDPTDMDETGTKNVTMQIVSAGPDDMRNDEIRDAMTLMISLAKKSVYIETPYFTPDTVFFTALKIAALSGKDVRVIVPGNWDKWYVKLAAMPFMAELLSYGVKFYRYHGFIHSKMMVIDGFIATIGSTNIDSRSFALHFELNAFFYSEEFGNQCAAMFDEDQKASDEMNAAWFGRISRIKKALWNFFKLFAPLL